MKLVGFPRSRLWEEGLHAGSLLENERHRIAQREDLNSNAITAEVPVSQSCGELWGWNGPS